MNNFLFKVFLVTAIFLPANKALGPADYYMEESSGGKLEETTIQGLSNSSIMIGFADKVSDVVTDFEDRNPKLDFRKKEDYSDEILRSTKPQPVMKQPKPILRNADPHVVNIFTPQSSSGPKTIRFGAITRPPKRVKATPSTLSGMSAWSKERREAHNRRIKEIGQHMQLHYLSTLYLYEEVRRIKTNRVILDELRLMVAYLEHPNNAAIKAYVTKCYAVYKPKQIKAFWVYDTNNLIINNLKDPTNDGVI